MRTYAQFAGAALIAALWLGLAGCGGGRQAVQSGVAPLRDRPLVFQSGKVPVNWTQFKWGDTTFNPYVLNGITSVGGNMWYTDYSGNKLIKMTMGGATTTFHLTCSCPTAGTLFYPGFVTVGSDGKLYISSVSPAGYIGIATQSGAFSVKKLASGDQTYGGSSAVGPDKNVWFTELGHYAKITPGGTITEFKYPDGFASNDYGAVTAGPNGDVWMTEYGQNQVDDIDPDTGALVSYGLPCAPIGLTVPGDGNVWAACSSDLLRITPSGFWTEISVPGIANDGYPSAFTTGPDGNPWWTISGHNDIATFNIALNQLTAYLAPSSFSADYGLTAGPDGNVWALDSAGKTDVYIVKVLKVTPSPNPLTFPAKGQKGSLTIGEPGTASWTVTSVSPGVCSVGAPSPANVFPITAAGVGTTTITVKDAVGNSFSVTCKVT